MKTRMYKRAILRIACEIAMGMLIVLCSVSANAEDSHFGFIDAPGNGGHNDFVSRALHEGFFSQESDYLPWAGNHFTNLNAKWTKPIGAIWEVQEPVLGGDYMFGTTDTTIMEFYDSGVRDLNIIVDFISRRERGGNPDIAPENEIYFRNFVRAFVERYDGDDDWGDAGHPSPELANAIQANPIKFFQGTNEPFPGWWISQGGTTDGYVRYLEIVNEGAKMADSGSTIILGTTFVDKEPGSGNLDVFKEVVQKMNGQRLFDYIDVHYWGNYPGRNDAYKTPQLGEIRQFLDSEGYPDVGMVILEDGTWVHQPRSFTYQSEKDQANYLIRNHVHSFANGVSLMIWTTMLDWGAYGGDEDSIFSHMGLISDGYNQDALDTLGVPRLSYYTYKLMVEKLEGSDWGNIETVIDGTDNVYAYKFLKAGKSVWVAWWDYFEDPAYQPGDTKTISLQAGFPANALVTSTVPSAESGADLNEADYPDFFNTDILEAASGEIVLTLSVDPLFVEVTPIQPPVAGFTALPLTGDAPLTVNFTDISTGNVIGWSWDFDNDSIKDSTVQNPTYIYNTPGTYSVTFTVTGPAGSDIETKTDYITVNWPAPVADFTASPTTGAAPLTVNFTDTSTGNVTSWSWDFDNDTVEDSTLQNPAYVYNTPGTYAVSLSVSGPEGGDTELKVDYITVTVPPPIADFTSDVTTGQAPLTVNFTDLSTGSATSWSWAFGDSGTSTLQDPPHEYTAAGTYTVTLTVSGPGGSDIESKIDYITVTGGALLPVKIGSAYEDTLQEGYDFAGEGDIIQSQDFVFSEDLNANIDKSVTLRCGYDSGFIDNSDGVTILNGDMTIDNGKLTIDSGTLRIQ